MRPCCHHKWPVAKTTTICLGWGPGTAFGWKLQKLLPQRAPMDAECLTGKECPKDCRFSCMNVGHAADFRGTSESPAVASAWIALDSFEALWRMFWIHLGERIGFCLSACYFNFSVLATEWTCFWKSQRAMNAGLQASCRCCSGGKSTTAATSFLLAGWQPLNILSRGFVMETYRQQRFGLSIKLPRPTKVPTSACH